MEYGDFIVVEANVPSNKLISIVVCKICCLKFGMTIFFGLNID